MARASRKNHVTSPPALSLEHVYNVCLYLRLSKEDSGDDHHDSIQMQEYLLREYVKKQSDMKLVAVFCDNGATGTNFDRPDFERMMDGVRRREVDCIVVKDLSRFGRNYVETGYYLEKIFPFLGVRFIAVSDRYDSVMGEQGDEMVVSLKNIVNALFAKDTSQKVGSALRRKQENGEFIGSWAPYGYLKSPDNKHKLILDPETAPIVSDIFTWRLYGAGYGEIAKRLNSHNIPSPTLTRFLRGEFTKDTPQTMSRLWIAATIKNITNNMVYAGHMAQGKRMSSLCQGIPRTEIDRNDWVIVRDTHEPIVSNEVWEGVASINQQAHKQAAGRCKLPKTENSLVGLVFCKDCGKTMTRLKSCSAKGHIRYTYNCRVRKQSKGASGCTNKRIGEQELEDIILHSIRIQIAATVEQEELLKILQNQKTYQQRQKEKALEDVRGAIRKNSVKRATLFEGYSDKQITENEYQYRKEKYHTKAKELLAEEEALLSHSIENSWIKAFSTYKGISHVTREMALDLIHSITIEGRCDVHIVWNFKDDYETLLRYMAKVNV